MNKADTRLLAEFLESPDRPDGTLRFHELQGFLFAIASSPETIPPSEWLPLIGNDADLDFANQNEAQQILGLVMTLFNQVNTSVLDRSNTLPPGCAFAKDILKNFDDDSSISQWSRGFSSGHNWLAEVWDGFLFGELDEECGATVMVLSFFESKRLANAYFKDMKPRKHKTGDESFENFAKTMREMFPDALASYSNIGRSIFEAVLEYGTAGREPVESTKIGRNEPCPCGSGKKYTKCCGGSIH
jgi:yecA family protein